MLKHKLLLNSDGGYFYRFYPKLRPPVAGKQFKTIQYTLFNPIEKIEHPNVISSVYGIFCEKYKEKDRKFILLLSKAEISFNCGVTNKLEVRSLQSYIELEVDDDFYNYNFIEKKSYNITSDTITEL